MASSSRQNLDRTLNGKRVQHNGSQGDKPFKSQHMTLSAWQIQKGSPIHVKSFTNARRRKDNQWPIPSGEWKEESLAKIISRRNYSKTPVSAIGQLERKTHASSETDRALILADQYIALLPDMQEMYGRVSPPIFTAKRSIRKIRGSQNLRDLSRRTSSSESASRISTLVSTDLSSLAEPPESSLPRGSPCKTSNTVEPSSGTACKNRKPEQSYVGLQICLDLLTDELANALYRQGPAESGDRRKRASHLQVLLLIEAYEGLLATCRQKLLWQDRREEREDIRSTVRILDHWLEALYVIYDGLLDC